MRSHIGLTLTIAGALALSGCGGGENGGGGSGTTGDEASPTTLDELSRDVQDAASTAGDYVQEQISKYRATMDDRMASLDEQLDSLRQRAGELDEQARAKLQGVLDELSVDRDALEQRLEELEASSADAWTELKAGLDQAWADLRAAVDDATDTYGGDRSGSGGG